MQGLPFPKIDPVIVHLGPLAIRWYSLAYIAGIVGGWFYVKWLNVKLARGITEKAIEDLVFYIIIGVVLGGRLGYVFIYQPDHYFEHPAEIFMLWRGGMSFHGGLLGVISATIYVCRKHKINFFNLMDLIACATPIGLFFGRLANFVNGELFGRVTGVPWGMVFPNGGDLPRHPSQLYEATLEGLLLFIILFISARYTRLANKVGALSGIFMLGYAIARETCEHFREPDEQLGYFFSFITMGQILSLPMILIGLYLIFRKQTASA